MPLLQVLMKSLMIALLLMVGNTANSQSLLREFTQQGLETIKSEHKGEPFLLVIWSLECPPCQEELNLLSRWRQENPAVKIVALAADPPNQAANVQDAIYNHGLEEISNWIFAQDDAAPLIYAIDADWYGEMPRNYFYFADHRRIGFSGRLTEHALDQWVAKTLP